MGWVAVTTVLSFDLKTAFWSTVIVNDWVAAVSPRTVAVMVGLYDARSFTSGVPSMVPVPLWLSTSVRPFGSPLALMVGVAVAHVVTRNEYVWPTVAVPGTALEITGGLHP